MKMTKERREEIKKNMNNMNVEELLQAIAEVAGELEKKTGGENYKNVAEFARFASERKAAGRSSDEIIKEYLESEEK